MRRRLIRLVTLPLTLMVMVVWAPIALAQQSSSTNYQVNEVFFGTGGELNACSTNYCSKQSAGEMTVGSTSSTNYKAQGGFNTDRQPYLEFIVTNTNTDLGVLSVGSTARTTATFSVKTYLAGGYVVMNQSDPPQSPYPIPHYFASPSSPTASAIGTEQFGINLVSNTSPVAFGADPVQRPDSTYSFGAAATGYNTANFFKYVKGDTVAQSTKSSGETDYTVSYIYNISNVTPEGTYSFNHILVATSTY